MAGITDLPFRIMCKRYGAGLVYTEMVSSKAMHYDDKKTMSLIATDEEEAPFAVQIFGSEPEIMAETAHKALSTGASILDINMGCPAPKVANNGDGSALLTNPELMGRIVRAVSDAVDVPVTCKIRSGFKAVADLEYIAKNLEANGASAITVHPRTREMYYSGTADRLLIKKVKDAVKIPVIGNGDVDSVESAEDMLKTTGCDGIMVGRGCYGRPWLFRELICHFEGLPYTPPENAEIKSVIRRQIRLLEADRGTKALLEMRKHLSKYCRGGVGSAKLREKINSVSTREEIEELIEILFP